MLLSKINQHIIDHFPEIKTAKLLLAVSAGVDSMVMLVLFTKLNIDITVAHCNFKLRGKESDLETVFLEKYLLKNNIPHHIVYFDTEIFAANNNLSIQLAARKLRYDWFAELLNKFNLDYVITAHHLDDQIETFLINLTRGTGLDGLLGIPPKNNKILRPLLNISREEILDYAILNKIEWCEDSSNASVKYLRNRIRHQIVPVLKELNTDFLQTFSHSLQHLNQFNDGFQDGFELLTEKIVNQTNDVYFIDLIKVKELKNPNAFLYHFLKPFEFSAWADIYALTSALSGKKIYSNKYVLLKDRDHLLLKKIVEEDKTEYKINDISDFSILPFKIFVDTLYLANLPNNNSINLDFQKLLFPLIVRKWKEGDFFYPSGMDGKKKISKYFKDQKFSEFKKQETWLLVQNNNIDIIWIIGQRPDKRYLAHTNLNHTLHIEI